MKKLTVALWNFAKAPINDKDLGSVTNDMTDYKNLLVGIKTCTYIKIGIQNVSNLRNFNMGSIFCPAHIKIVYLFFTTDCVQFFLWLLYSYQYICNHTICNH